ncbi:MFS transporter [Streptomyces sp. NBRC 109706]|uniref:MFS transporter n=1 Tax=Streptomyces sp. NBRC 109706 TaxID=1550035 RepID=UPI000A60293E|nr:MFS transporter [Streptomyces sp. NBRC 109706]
MEQTLRGEPASIGWRVRALVAGYSLSAYGNFLNLIALSLFTYQVVGTALGLGAVMALRLFSGVLAGLGAGAITTALGRRTVMIGADLAQAVAMTVLALSARDPSLVLLLGAVVVLGAGNTLFTVALRSAVPVIVGHDQRTRANGMLVTARSFATVLGYASAAGIIAVGGYGLAFAVNGATFVVSAGAVLALRPRTDVEAESDAGATADAARGESAPGRPPGALSWRPAAGIPALLLGMLLLRGVDAFASSSHNVALPIVADLRFPDNPALFMTQFWVAWAVGTSLSHQLLSRFRGERVYGARVFALGTGVMSISFALAFTGLPVPALIVAALVAGLADGCTEIVYVSRLQAVPERERGRLFGLSASAETAGFSVGMLGAAAALEGLPAFTVVAAFHGTALCGALALALYVALRRHDALRPHHQPS